VGYVLNGEELEVDDEGFLTEANFSDEIVPVIAEAEDIKLTDQHWQVVNFMRHKYQEDGHTPNFRNMVAGLDEEHPGADWKKILYELFPKHPNRQSV
jgi:TusE/DsrC/DsvC family sulfur relay protein